MPRTALLALLLAFGCNKTAPPEQSNATPAPLLSASVAAVADASAPQSAWYVGRWKGDFTAAKRSSTTTTKEGGPAAWAKDDGQIYVGPGSLAVTIDASGQLTGTLSGSLGDMALRGKVEGEDVRATLVPKGDDPKSIRNGYLALVRDGDVLKGHLNAATGDALTLRHAEVALKKAAP